jgi:bacterioferritin (cytochrome b1)
MTSTSSEIVEGLNQLLQGLTSALQQLRIHRVKCEFWGYEKLYVTLSNHFHALNGLQDKIITRLLAMDAHIDSSTANHVRVGQTVEDILSVERATSAEITELTLNCLKLAHANIPLRNLLESLALSEDARQLDLDQRLELLRQMGTQQFLSSRC